MKQHPLNQGHYMNRFELPDIVGTSLGLSSFFIKEYTGVGFNTILPSNLLTWIFDKGSLDLNLSVVLVALSGLILAGFNAAFLGAMGWLGTKAVSKTYEWAEKKLSRGKKRRKPNQGSAF